MGLGKRRSCQLIGTVCAGAVFLCEPKVALAQAGQPSQQGVRELKLSDFFVPADLGYVTDTSAPSAGPKTQPTIIHIQEAHTNYDAQKHIVSILERLIQQYGLKLILVEGGEGDLNISYLRNYGSPENRREVAEKYLRAGIVSAEEYLDIVSDYPFTIWGVEQKGLYQENVKAFMDSEQLAEHFKPILAEVRQTVEQLKPKLVDPAWLALEQQTKAFEAEQLRLADYVDGGLAAAGAHGITVTEQDAPHLIRFVNVRKLEPQIDATRVGQEQRQVFEQLAQRLTATELNGLLDQAKQMKDGTLARETFYAQLKTEILAAGLSLETTPQLARYISYIEERHQLKPGAMVQELQGIVGRLKHTLTATPASQQLQAISDQLDVIEKLIAMKLSPSEYQQFETLEPHAMFTAWRTFLTEQLAKQGMPSRSFDSLTELEAAIPRLQRFYTAANDRDDVLARHAAEKLRQTGDPLAVLITGGFHSPKITQLLKAQGFGVVVLTPRVDHPTDERLYRAVLKYKNGDGSFDDVMNLADAGQHS